MFLPAKLPSMSLAILITASSALKSATAKSAFGPTIVTLLLITTDNPYSPAARTIFVPSSTPVIALSKSS